MSGFDVKKIQTKIDEFIAKYPSIDGPLSTISSQTSIDKSILAVGGALVSVLLLFAIGGGAFIVDLVGFAYPLYASLKAIESKGVEDDAQWLTYWLIFSILKIVDELAGVITQLIPFYFLFKVVFLVYCYHPSTKGAAVVYSQLLRPYVIPLLGLDKPGTGTDASSAPSGRKSD
eukprot:gene7462-15267_t